MQFHFCFGEFSVYRKNCSGPAFDAIFGVHSGVKSTFSSSNKNRFCSAHLCFAYLLSYSQLGWETRGFFLQLNSRAGACIFPACVGEGEMMIGGSETRQLFQVFLRRNGRSLVSIRVRTNLVQSWTVATGLGRWQPIPMLFSSSERKNYWAW